MKHNKIKLSLELEFTPYVLSCVKSAAALHGWTVEEEIKLMIEGRLIERSKEKAA